jgi:hypothetical protein
LIEPRQRTLYRRLEEIIPPVAVAACQATAKSPETRQERNDAGPQILAAING